jgi:glycine/D-amino acid oxidase-like deaminating enzyme
LINKVDCIVVGQGLAGSWVAYWLLKENQSFVVIDKSEQPSSSAVSSGIINPVSGRRPIKTWLIDELTAFATEHYAAAETLTQTSFFFKRNIVRLFPNEEVKQFYEARKLQGGLTEEIVFAHDAECNQTIHALSNVLHIPHGACCIKPAYRLNSPHFIQTFRQLLSSRNALLEEQFQHSALTVSPSSVSYKNIQAKHIIFCEGYQLLHNPFHSALPLVPNNGDYLLVRIPALPTDTLIHGSVFIVPVGNGLFWVGSDYQLNNTTNTPNSESRKTFEAHLQQMLNTDYKVVEHGTGIRPTVKDERRPFVGVYPQNTRVALLNGLGTKGTSLAPYFARQLVSHLLHQTPIHPEADVARFY